MRVSTVRLPAPDLPPGPRSALVIATTTYDDPDLRQLRAPAADALEFAGVLANPSIGGFEVTSVVDRPAQEVRIAIEEFLDGRAPEDLVVVYFSCHGVTDARRRLYFAATDTFKSRLGATGVASMWVNDQMEECRARRQVLILDCCFSGAFARGAKGAETLDLDHLTEPGQGRAVLTASKATEYSWVETAAGGQPTPNSPAPGSVFTAALLAGLRDGSADRDGDGFVTVDEAYAYAYQQVRATGAAQTPQRWLSGGEGQLLLARNPAGRPVIPTALPESLRAALDSQWPNVRIGAVEELRDWLTSGDPPKVVTATRELEDIAENDIPRVAAAARSALEHVKSPDPTPSADPSISQHVSVRADPDQPTAAAPTPLLGLVALRHWYQEAADAGDTDAMNNLGNLLSDQLDPPDLAGARHWYQQAADAGHTDAMNNLGNLLSDQLDPPDLAGARHWYQQAADAGHTDAMNNLGNLLSDQLDPPDLAGARHWYQQAADAGHTDAMNNLGNLLSLTTEPTESPRYARALSAIAALLLILAGASFAWAGRTLPGSSGTQIADLAVAASFVVLGAGLLVTRSQWNNTGWRATAGLCIGLLPFLSLRMLRSAELLSLRMSRSDEPHRGEELFGLWGPLALILLALILIGILLARNPEVAFARPRVFGDSTATAIVFGVAAVIGLAAIGVALPTPRDNFTSGKFSDPMLLYIAVLLAIVAAVTQGLLRAAVLAGWTAGAAGVLVTTVFFRLRPKNIPEVILDAHLVLSILTVAILATLTVLALRKS